MEAPQRQDLGLVHFRGLSAGGKKVETGEEKGKEVGKGMMTPFQSLGLLFFFCVSSHCVP